MNSRLNIALLLCVAVTATYSFSQDTITVIYVDSSAPAGGDGVAWQSAFREIHDGLDIAEAGDHIWVAAGVYTPEIDGDNPRRSSFRLKPQVNVYGGFNGTETTRSEAKFRLNRTELSGDIGVVGDSADNSYHVVTGADNVEISGFYIAGGNADGSASADQNIGGGLYSNAESMSIVNCFFHDNKAEFGGGFFNGDTNTNVVSSIFVENVATSNGGAIYDERGDLTVSSSLIVGNRATVGAGIYNSRSSPQFIHCTIAGNFAIRNGGALANESSDVTITNCILWNNVAANDGDIFYTVTGSTNLNVTSSCIEGGFEGSGNIDDDPEFLDTDRGVYYLQVDSPCIEAASPLDPAVRDLLGVDRPIGEHSDMGAYENLGLPVVYMDSIDVLEDSGSAIVTVVLDRQGNPGSAPISISYSLETVDATPILDFGDPDGTLFWEATVDGTRTISIPIVRDSLVESRELFAIQFAREDVPGFDDDTYIVLTPHAQVAIQSHDIFHVRQGAVSGNGLSWEQALGNLQDALHMADVSDEIWVAAGVYLPTSDPDPTAAFILDDGVELYGGFAGHEESRAQRTPESHTTILSGDIGLPNVSSDNVYHVIVSSGEVRIDNVIVTNGNARNGSTNRLGGGIYHRDGLLELSNSNIVNNVASVGGGIYIIGGMSCLTDCSFGSNSAGAGGAINMRSSVSTIERCDFSGNEATNTSGDIGGGGARLQAANAKVANCIFFQNVTERDGGAISSVSSSKSIFTNCTFTQNAAARNGGALHFSSTSSATVVNCILWNDSASVSSHAEVHAANATSTFEACLIRDASSLFGVFMTGTDRGGNIDRDPLFEDILLPRGNDGVFRSDDDGLRVTDSSPCIDAGRLIEASDRDVVGISRPQFLRVDIGAFEHFRSASVGGVVWIDLDSDGILDESETGFPQLAVQLFALDDGETIAASDSTPIRTTHTNEIGGYTFTNVRPGNYSIGIRDLPLGYDVAPADHGSDEQDSDIGETSRRTPVIMLVSDESLTNVSAGFAPRPLTIIVGSLPNDVVEGGSITIDIQLSSVPADTIEISLVRISGDPDLVGGSSVSFTQDNWHIAQSLTLQAEEDDDVANSSADFRITKVTGSNPVGDIVFSVNEDDDDFRLTINSMFGEPLGAGIYERDAVATWQVVSPYPTAAGENGVRHVTDTATGTTVMTADKTITIDWRCQYLLTLNSVDSAGMPLGNPQGAGWYDENSIASWSVTSPFVVRPNASRYRAVTQDGMITMNAAESIDINWQRQWYLEARTNNIGSLDIESGWHDDQEDVAVTAVNDALFTFLRWYGDVDNGTDQNNPLTIPMNMSRRIFAVFGVSGDRETFNVTPKSGWNLISFPVFPDAPAVSEVFGLQGDEPLWYFENGNLYSSPIVIPQVGYWIYCRDSDPITISGIIDMFTNRVLESGWHLIGVTDTSPIPGSAGIAWEWDENHFRVANELERFKGYWIYCE